jgi:hypothetical protein
VVAVGESKTVIDAAAGVVANATFEYALILPAASAALTRYP